MVGGDRYGRPAPPDCCDPDDWYERSRATRSLDSVTDFGLAFFLVVALLGLAVRAWDLQMASSVPDVSSRIDALSR